MVIAASWIVPVCGPPIRRGAVRVRDGVIKQIGAREEFVELASIDGKEAVRATGVVELEEAILTPGLVNPHTHLELTCYEGRIAARPFWSWLTELVKLRRAPGASAAEEACIAEAAWRSLRAGVTCIGDISRRNTSWRALKAVPIRKVCFVELLTLADDPPRTPEELVAELESMETDELLTAGITPHAPYSVPAEQVAELGRLARRRGLRFTTHWAETMEEVAFLRGEGNALPPLLSEVMESAGVRSPRMSPIEYLESCLSARAVGDGGEIGAAFPGSAAAGNCGWSIAHGNYVTEGEYEAIRRASLTVIYCPRAHAYFGHSRHPFVGMRSRGVRVALGTDSAASNVGNGWRRAVKAKLIDAEEKRAADGVEERLSLLDEARFVAAHESIGREDLLKMITMDAAGALGLGDRIGTIEPGKSADLAAWNVEGVMGGDPVAALFGASVRAIGVWVAGRRVV